MALTKVTTSVIKTTTTGTSGQVLTAGTNGDLVWVNQANLAVGGANVTGTVATASTVTTNAQPNITSVGTLSSLTTTGDIVVGGNLTVDGTMTTVHSTEVALDDKNLTLANSATTAAQANGGGITLNGANATMLYKSSDDTWNFNKQIVGNLTGTASTANLAAYATTANSVAAANVTGTVANATYAATSGESYSVAAANITGTVSFATNSTNANLATYATTANSVAVANVSGIGNIAVVNLSGNASNVLYGNGIFAAPTGGSGSSTLNVQEFTANANQTSFTISNTASGNVMFSINGVLIRPSAVSVSNVTVTYTAANNSSYALIANDSVIISYISN